MKTDILQKRRIAAHFGVISALRSGSVGYEGGSQLDLSIITSMHDMQRLVGYYYS